MAVVDNSFSPDLLTVATGDTVTWTWSGLNTHSVTFADGGGSSSARSTGTFQRIFRTTGTFTYQSIVATDSAMTGVIVVQ